MRSCAPAVVSAHAHLSIVNVQRGEIPFDDIGRVAIFYNVTIAMSSICPFQGLKIFHSVVMSTEIKGGQAFDQNAVFFFRAV
jgi:hypothetical protein